MKKMSDADRKAREVRTQIDKMIEELEHSEDQTCPVATASGAVCGQHPLVIKSQKATLALIAPMYDKVTNGGLSYVKIFGIHFQGNAATMFVKGLREICIFGILLYIAMRGAGVHLCDVFQKLSEWL